jgi:hypothetical protein
MMKRALLLPSFLVIALGACSDLPAAPDTAQSSTTLRAPSADVRTSAAPFVGGDIVAAGAGVAEGLPVTGDELTGQLNIVAMATDPASGHFRLTLRSLDGRQWRIAGTVEGDITSATIEGNAAHVQGIVRSASGELASMLGEPFHSHLVDSGPSASEPDKVHWHWGNGPCACEGDESMMWPAIRGNIVVRAGGGS